MPTALTMSARRRSLFSVRGQGDVAVSDTNGSFPDDAEEDLGETDHSYVFFSSE